MTFDFAKYKDADNIAQFSPSDPDTEVVQKDVVFDLVGCDSSVYKSCRRRSTNKVLAKAQKNAKKVATAESIEDERVDRIAQCIKGWRGVMDDGQDVPYSYDAAVKLLTEGSWLKEQIEEFIEERSNFLTK